MLANEVRAAGIKVNAVSPGYCATDLNDHQGIPTGEFHGQDGALPW